MSHHSAMGWLFTGCLGLLSVTGCATSGVRGPKAGDAAAEAAARSDASGVWDWVYRSTDEQGDVRVEQEEWHLDQKNGQISGYYDRAVTMMSADDRLFRCNQKLGFTKVTRVRINGRVEGERIVLRETSFEVQPGPCEDGARNLVAYTGVLRTGSLALKWGPEAGQTLVRRPGVAANAQPARSDMLPVANITGRAQAPAGLPASASSGANLSALGGTWEWELRSIDAEGDERAEREEWHLTEQNGGLTGYYDRTVSRIRGDGVFSCNNQGRYETRTRYRVTGQRVGDRISLTELEYQVSPSGCDNAQRRLDSYQGHVSADESLVLSWGPGNQLLRKKR